MNARPGNPYTADLRNVGLSKREVDEIAAFRFLRDLCHLCTGIRAPYRVRDAYLRLQAHRALEQYANNRRTPGSPFTTITGPAGTTTGQSR